jgi:hemin uptake protein HemP
MQNERNRRLEAEDNLGRVLTSQTLFQGRRRIQIDHRGETYRLQITRQGKLLLTK